MVKGILLSSALLFTTSIFASAPSYFTQEIDGEYRALMKHAKATLPQTNLPLAYLPALYPYGLLDVHPTKLKYAKDKQAFANFNFGVFSRMFLGLDKEKIALLPSLFFCNQQNCKEDRLAKINTFLEMSVAEIESLKYNDKVFIVQQTAPHVFRVNNTFYSPTELITYFPSEGAGFIPSNNFNVSNPDHALDLMALAEETNSIRTLMDKYQVSAISKTDNGDINIIFEGIGDNQWGVMLHIQSNPAVTGDINHIGFKYAEIIQISEHSFYYQTN